jgi:starch synthase
MDNVRILYISHEISPYNASDAGDAVQTLASKIQGKKKEIRVFMPRFGSINERRFSLHEVQRLSGNNVEVNDSDHPVVVKVASLREKKMQVYFIDNDEYFKRKFVFADKEGNWFDDNDERAIFFAKGVLDAVKRQGWAPDIIHCNGWMSALVPMMLKKVLKDDPHYTNAKVVFTAHEGDMDKTINPEVIAKLKMEGFVDADLEGLQDPSVANINLKGLEFADAITEGAEGVFESLKVNPENYDKTVLPFSEIDGNLVDAYNNMYDAVLAGSEITA